MKIEQKAKTGITFNESVEMGSYVKAMDHFGKAFKLLSGRDAMYSDFTAWLAVTDFVKVEKAKSKTIVTAEPTKVVMRHMNRAMSVIAVVGWGIGLCALAYIVVTGVMR